MFNNFMLSFLENSCIFALKFSYKALKFNR